MAICVVCVGLFFFGPWGSQCSPGCNAVSTAEPTCRPQALEGELAAAAAAAAAEEGHVRLLASHGAGVRLEIKHAQGRVSSPLLAVVPGGLIGPICGSLCGSQRVAGGPGTAPATTSLSAGGFFVGLGESQLHGGVSPVILVSLHRPHYATEPPSTGDCAGPGAGVGAAAAAAGRRGGGAAAAGRRRSRRPPRRPLRPRRRARGRVPPCQAEPRGAPPPEQVEPGEEGRFGF